MFHFLSILYLFYLSITIRFMDRERWVWVLVFFLISFGFYFLLAHLAKKMRRNWVLVYGVLLRFSMILVLPVFSDDFYRFLWDGYLVSHFQFPYDLTPNMWLQFHPEQKDSLLFLYNHLNSSDYFSVYPLFLQICFALPWLMGAKSLWIQIMILQLILFFVELLCLFLMKKELKSAHLLWLYAGNPILILESISQVHFEIIILLLLLILVSRTSQGYRRYTDLIYVLLINIKINLIFLLPAFVLRREPREVYRFSIYILSSFLLLYFTVFNHFNLQMASGIGLFFHSFRFHSLFENIIYVSLLPFPDLIYLSGSISLILGGILFLLILLKYSLPLEIKVLLGLLILLLFSPVLHSWYILPFVGLSIYCRYHIQLSLILTIFSGLSYLLYGIKSPAFSFGLGLMELSILGVYIWKHKPSSFLQKTQFSEK